MKDTVTVKMLQESVASHPKGDVPFEVLQLGRGWKKLLPELPDKLFGFQICVVPWRCDDDVYLVSSSTYGFQEEKVSLQSGRAQAVIRFLRGGVIEVTPSGQARHWWGSANLGCDDGETMDAFCAAIGGGHEHGCVELPCGSSVTMHDWDVQVSNYQKANSERDIATIINREYGTRINIDQVTTAIKEHMLYALELEGRENRYKKLSTKE